MESKQKQIEKRYLVYQVFKHLWFVGAVWLLFYRFFMTDQSVGVLDALSFGFGLLVEIPSGGLADHFGRKKITIIGIAIAAAGMFLQGLAQGYAVLLISQMIISAGWAFRSGADDAFFYDSLDYDEDSSHWKKLASKGNQVGLIADLCTYLIGGFLYTISPRLPFLASIFTAGGILTLIGMPEIKRTSRSRGRVRRNYVKSLRDGIMELKNKNLIGYLPIIVIVQGLFYTFGYGLLRPILQTRFDFGASAGSWVLFICGLTALGLQRLQLHFIDSISEKLSVLFLVYTTALALLLGALPLGHIGFIVILILYVNEYLMGPLISNGLNKHVRSEHRATALSAASFLQALPYVIAAPLIGYFNVRGRLHYYLIAMATMSLLAGMVYLLLVKEKKNVSVPVELGAVQLNTRD